MVAPDRLLAFTLAAFVFAVIPGPSVLFIVSRGVAHGRRVAVATVLGNATGTYVHITLVAVGLGAALARSVVLFEVIRLAGAAYLVWLGLQAWRSRRSLALGSVERTPVGSFRAAMREGFWVGVGNPKSVVFFGAVLPQFVEPGLGHVPLQLLTLGLAAVLVAIASDCLYGVAAGTARAWMSSDPRRLQRLGGTGGLAMVGLGLGLAVSGRPER